MTALTSFAAPEPAVPPDAAPVVATDADGRYVISWPRGRPAQFVIASSLFESMVADINQGRHVVDVLQGVAEALARVVPSAAETQSGTP